MGKAFYFRFLILLGAGIFFFHSCTKDRGKLPPAPFNLNVVEGFENSTSIPSGWTWWNPDNDAKWEVCTTVAHAGKNCLGFNNCSGNGTSSMTGRKDRCITISYDFTKATSASISFDVAYAVLNSKNKNYTDTLAVYSSTDGGSTWSRIYLKGGEDLTNIPIITTPTPCWEPASPTDWRTDKIAVNSLAGKPKVMFAFENRSDWGEWIYIDNFTVTATNANNGCDDVTYTKNVKPLMKTECAIAGCHVPGGSNPTDLDTYAGVKAIADNGHLKKRMMDGNPSFMPPAGKLPASTLSSIQCWLDNGAPNN